MTQTLTMVESIPVEWCTIRNCSERAVAIWQGEHYCDEHNPYTLATATLAHRDAIIADLHARLAELHRAYQAVLHRAERAEEQLGATVRATRREPALTVYCDNPGCDTPPLTMAVLPPEDAIPLWVAGLGWQVCGDEYRCGRCRS